MELLAPAGSSKQLLAALEAGADAVYLGGQFFSARKYASNFNKEEMEAAVRACHVLGVPVYVTLNTLVADSEWKQLEEYLRFLEDIHVDGLLLQDWGVVRVAKRCAPHIPLHGSTQMTVTNLAGVQFLKSLHFTRVVLSRELSLNEIKHICSNTDVEIEVFVHGALCVCYSGQCLMSSFIGGRSGNRGACAQPCRMPYKLISENGGAVSSSLGRYILSLKDMIGLDHLEALKESGVTSLKIEGRMKEPEYVYSVVSAYRQVLDALASGQSIDQKAQLQNMMRSFNRGYTHGYYDGIISRDMVTGTAPGNQGVPAGKVTDSRKGFFCFPADGMEESCAILGLSYLTKDKEIQFLSADRLHFLASGKVKAECEKSPAIGTELFWHIKNAPINLAVKNLKRKVPVHFQLFAVPGKSVRLTAADSDGYKAETVSDYVAEPARHPVSDETIMAQLNRLGSTFFTMAGAKVQNQGCLIPQSVLNRLRQAVTEELAENRVKGFKAKFRQEIFTEPIRCWRGVSTKRTVGEPRLMVRTDSCEQAFEAMDNSIQGVIFGGESFHHRSIPIDEYAAVLKRGRSLGIPVVFASPRVVKEADCEKEKRKFLSLGALKPDAMEIQFPGALVWARELPEEVAVECGSSMNVFNSEAAEEMASWGFSAVWLSQELTLQQILRITKKCKIPVGVQVFGRTEMMISEYCVINALLGKKDKAHCDGFCLKNCYALKDKDGRQFPIRTDERCHMHILNSAVLDMRPYMHELFYAGIARFSLDLRGMDADTGDLIRSYFSAIKKSPAAQSDRCGQVVTRGHFFRGILQAK